MANDFLGKLAKQANQQLGNNESPFKQKKEVTRPVQVREGTYKMIKDIAYHKEAKIVDVIDSMLKYAINSGEFDENNK